MRTETIVVCSISELSKDAQKVAHTEYLNSGFEYFWLGEYLDSLKKFAACFNLKIKKYSLGAYQCSVDYSIVWDCYSAKYSHSEVIENMSGIRLARYIHNNFYWCMYENKTFWKGDKKRKSKIQKVCDCPFTGYCGDMGLLDPILKFLAKPDKNVTFANLLSQCIDSFVKAVESDCEHQESLQYFIEHAEANEYEFTEDGKRY